MDKLAEWFNTLIDFFYRCLLSVFDFFKDFLWFVLDSLFGAAISILDSMDFDLASLNPASYINAIPNEVKWMMTQCGFNECMAIIAVALTVRFVLQIIPFVRFGS